MACSWNHKNEDNHIKPAPSRVSRPGYTVTDYLDALPNNPLAAILDRTSNSSWKRKLLHPSSPQGRTNDCLPERHIKARKSAKSSTLNRSLSDMGKMGMQRLTIKTEQQEQQNSTVNKSSGTSLADSGKNITMKEKRADKKTNASRARTSIKPVVCALKTKQGIPQSFLSALEWKCRRKRSVKRSKFAKPVIIVDANHALPSSIRREKESNFGPVPVEPFQVDAKNGKEEPTLYQLLLGALIPEVEDKDTCSSGFPDWACSDSQYDIKSLNNRCLMELQYLGIFPDFMPDIISVDDDDNSEDITSLQNKYRFQAKKSKGLPDELLKLPTEKRELKKKELDQCDTDRATEKIYEDVKGHDKEVLSKYINSKVGRPLTQPRRNPKRNSRPKMTAVSASPVNATQKKAEEQQKPVSPCGIREDTEGRGPGLDILDDLQSPQTDKLAIPNIDEDWLNIDNDNEPSHDDDDYNGLAIPDDDLMSLPFTIGA